MTINESITINSERTDLKEKLSKVKMFVLDMDGTIYLGDRLFPYTKDFLNRIKSSGKDFSFFTNNSSKNRKAYIDKLANMGINITEKQMLLSNNVIIKWLSENHKGESAYVVGTELLVDDFRSAGIVIDDENPDYVVLGFDTTLTYSKLENACNFIRDGKPIYGVNPDLNCPTETGFIPDCGSMAALIKASTGVQCEFFGKPSRHTLNYILDFTGLNENEVAIIGDRIYTDIKTADGTDVTSILVLSGEATIKDLEQSDVKPDIVVNNIGELIDFI